jgi:Fe-S oxidoreductase
VLDFRDERELLTGMHVELETPDSGCCGLAGSFGYEAEHYDISMAIGERALLPAVRAERPDSLVIADGFSCREQIRHGTGRTALHLAEVVALALRALERAREPELRPAPQPAATLGAAPG